MVLSNERSVITERLGNLRVANPSGLPFDVIPESCSPGSVVRRTCSLAKLRDPRQNSSGMTLAFVFCLSSFPNVVVGNPLFAGAVILESCSPGSVVRRTCSLAKLRYLRTLRAARVPPAGNGEDKNSPRKKALAPKQALERTSKKPTILCFGRVIQQICHTLRNIPPAGLLVSIQAKLRQYSKQMVKNITLQRFVIGPNRRV